MIAEQVVDRLLAERKSLLNSAFVAVVEALRMNPDGYTIIYKHLDAFRLAPLIVFVLLCCLLIGYFWAG